MVPSLQGHALRQLNCSQLHKRAERIGAYIMEKLRVNSGDHIALLYPPGIELIVAFYGCLYVGEFMGIWLVLPSTPVVIRLQPAPKAGTAE